MHINDSNTPIKYSKLSNAYFCAYLDLEQDLLFDKIPSTQILHFIDGVFKSIEELVQTVDQVPIKKVLMERNIDVEIKKKNMTFFNLHLRAQFKNNQTQNTITIFKDSMDDLAEALGMTADDVELILLTHEYFHYLELQKGIEIGEKLHYKAALGIKRESSINRLSEIAANRFTQIYLKLPFLPSALDYQYLLAKGELEKSYLDERYQVFTKL